MQREQTINLALTDKADVARAATIRALNDRFRKTLTDGTVLLSAGIIVLGAEAQAQIIAKSHGIRGPNCDYLYATTDHLAKLDIADADLAWLSTRVRELRNLNAN